MSSIEIELFAPYNEVVELTGSWNDWQPMPMMRGDDGRWRTTVDLEDGIYEYQFELISLSPGMEGQRVRVGDPTALRLTHQDRTQLIVRNGGVVVTDYTWQDSKIPLPQNHELILYELHASDFTGTSTHAEDEMHTSAFAGIIDKLPYLADLGINAIQLMPVNDFPGRHNWGYSQRSLYAVEDHYGTPEELCRLIDACHSLGIRVIHDGVYNHMDENAILPKIDYNLWFYERDDNPDKPEMHYGPKFNYMWHDEKLNVWPARAYVIGAMRLWMDTFHFDGIRFDSTRALRYYELLQWFYNEMHGRNQVKPFLAIAEHLPEDPGIAGPGGPMDAAWHMTFFTQVVATLTGKGDNETQPFSPKAMIGVLDCRSQGYAGPAHVVNFIDNHDHDRILWQIRQSGLYDEEAAWRRAKLGASLLLTAPGIPMLCMGEEFGMSLPKKEPDVPVPLDWSLLEKAPNQKLWQHYRRLIQLRKENRALTGNTFEVITQLEERGIFAFRRWHTEGEAIVNHVIVVVNLCDEAAKSLHFYSPWLEDGTWCEVLCGKENGKEMTVSNHQFHTDMAASEVKLYVYLPKQETQPRAKS